MGWNKIQRIILITKIIQKNSELPRVRCKSNKEVHTAQSMKSYAKTVHDRKIWLSAWGHSYKSSRYRNNWRCWKGLFGTNISVLVQIWKTDHIVWTKRKKPKFNNILKFSSHSITIYEIKRAKMNLFVPKLTKEKKHTIFYILNYSRKTWCAVTWFVYIKLIELIPLDE